MPMPRIILNVCLVLLAASQGFAMAAGPNRSEQGKQEQDVSDMRAIAPSGFTRIVENHLPDEQASKWNGDEEEPFCQRQVENSNIKGVCFVE